MPKHWAGTGWKRVDWTRRRLTAPETTRQRPAGQPGYRPGDTPFDAAYNTWILAGSAGGVAAVARFLEALPAVPPVAFLYAQHIQADQQALLRAISHHNRELVFELALGRHRLTPRRVLIVPATCQLGFAADGEIYSREAPWPGPETPGFDRLLESMVDAAFQPAGAIIFSGNGRDGTAGFCSLHNRGTQVWAQAPASCAAPSMPRAAIEAGICQFQGTPEALAARFLGLWS